METETLSLLCSPYTHEALQLVLKPDKEGFDNQYLKGVQTGACFPIRNGIPVLYDAARLGGYNLHYNQVYRQAARWYDPALKVLALLSGGGEANFRQEFLQLLEIEDGSRVLETSVGTGTNLCLLPARARCYGLDLSWEMLDRCQRNLQRRNIKAELIYGNAECLPFRDAAFNVVFHVGGINAFSDRAKAIEEMIRVARPGTRIVIADETAKMLEKLAWMPAMRRMIEEWGDRFEAPVKLIPPGMREVHVDTAVKGLIYVLSFRTP